ncbi:dual specificity mitogen-activated protein kinase kinase [Thraustotheca clavata]|uniref:mitogen-activated protein kinase kinase n=1 Tax=Thraustotheca clavata TaxID=74557 RepID=A0A1V9ZXW4_9STRA|nr:dual specificity mitogen-activated protein kinase kinase [Thraustotheca clavata]
MVARSFRLHSFGHVKNIGECATLATTIYQTLFTYVPSTQDCLVYEYVQNGSAPSIHMLDRNEIIIDALPETFQTADEVNGATLNDCVKACKNTFCAGYRLDESSCKLYAPSIHSERTNQTAGFVIKYTISHPFLFYHLCFTQEIKRLHFQVPPSAMQADKKLHDESTGKRVRVESMNYCPQTHAHWFVRRKGRRQLQRSLSVPNLDRQVHQPSVPKIFPDVDVRSLRLAEVRSWKCPWMESDFGPRNEDTNLEHVVEEIYAELTQENQPKPVAQHGIKPLKINSTATPTSSGATESPHTPPPITPIILKPKRPVLRLKLEDMPTSQQAENRANRAANQLLARRDALEKENQPSATSHMQRAMIDLKLTSFGSNSDSDNVLSPTNEGEGSRFSQGSAYSPNHGMFTTKSVSVSEAGIASPDATHLHLQENLVRVREVGRGASGIVFKAVHIPTLKVVAIKDVPVYGKGQRRQMVRELHALYANLAPLTEPRSHTASSPSMRLPSPYIVSFYDAFVDKPKNCICLVMEYMGVGSLQDMVTHGGCSSEKILCRIANSVLRGLSHIHANRMVHRDVKPHNLLMNHQGEIKISDFGLARTLNENAMHTKTFVGTLLYMAPERISGSDYGCPADIWSFGLVLISVALGRYPLPTQDGFFGLFDSVVNEEFLKVPTDVFSRDFQDFLDKCLTIDPEERWTAEQLLNHRFVTKFSSEETLSEWKQFVAGISEPRQKALEDISDAVMKRVYERSAKCFVPQSDYGMSMLSTERRESRGAILPPIQTSLQLGLANYLELPPPIVFQMFEQKRLEYEEKLLEDHLCLSPQSWANSPGDHRRQSLLGISSSSMVVVEEEAQYSTPPHQRRPSFWTRLHNSVKNLTRKKS